LTSSENYSIEKRVGEKFTFFLKKRKLISMKHSVPFAALPETQSQKPAVLIKIRGAYSTFSIAQLSILDVLYVSVALGRREASLKY
jgi:hypothetical protein